MIIILAIFAFSIIYLFTIIGMTGSKGKVKGGFIGAIWGIIFMTFLYGAIFLDARVDDEAWNNGVCPSCGQEWVFKSGSAIRGAHGHEYYYSCDDCHNTIRIHSMR